MSRGPGRIERKLAAAFEAEPDRAFTTAELCRVAYPGEPTTTKARRVSVLRALRHLIDRIDTLRAIPFEKRGSELIWFNMTSLASYASARARAYSRSPSAAELAEGSAWHGHVVSWREEIEARRAGDVERLNAVLAQREAENAELLRMLRTLG